MLIINFDTFHAILNHFYLIFWNFKSSLNHPISKFWVSDFTKWWNVHRRFISEKFVEQLVKPIKWPAENLKKCPKTLNCDLICALQNKTKAINQNFLRVIVSEYCFDQLFSQNINADARQIDTDLNTRINSAKHSSIRAKKSDTKRLKYSE